MKKRPGCLIAVGVVALLGIVGIATGGGSDDEVTSKVSDSSSDSVQSSMNDNSSTADTDGTSTDDTSVDNDNTADSEAKETETKEEKAEYEITNTSFKLWTNSIGTNWEQAIVEITNTGTCDLYLSDGSYDVEDANGHLIESQSYVSVFPDVLKPGEKGYMYEETTFDGDDVSAEYTILPRVDIKKAKVDCIRYEVSDVSIKDEEYLGIKVIGRVENTTDEVGEMVYVDVILYDKSGAPIGRVFTILDDDLQPGDKIGFEASEFSMPDGITSDDVASYTIYAYPLQFQF